jgi:hypothetical protein
LIDSAVLVVVRELLVRRAVVPVIDLDKLRKTGCNRPNEW